MLKIKAKFYFFVLFLSIVRINFSDINACHDAFILHNNSSTEQHIFLRFSSRILVKNNDAIFAPAGFKFVINRDERVSFVTPNFSNFSEFERRNFNAEIESEIVLSPGAEQTISRPYTLTRKVNILHSAHAQISIDLNDLYYIGSADFPECGLKIKKENNLQSSTTQIIKHFRFSRDQYLPDPSYERTKPTHLRNPASLIRAVYGKTDEDALQGIHYLEKSSLSIVDKSKSLPARSTDMVLSEKSYPTLIEYPYPEYESLECIYERIVDPDPVYEHAKFNISRGPAPLIHKVYSKSDAEVLRGIDYLERSSLRILNESKTPYLRLTAGVIPKKTHRMWITDPYSPVEPPEEQLEYYIGSLARLNLTEGWTHKFWCWDKRQLPKTCKILENCGQNVEIVEFCHPQVFSGIIASHFVFAAIDHGLFTVAGNILRNNVLLRDGGFYTDIGAEFRQDPSSLLNHSDIIAHHRIGRVDRKAWWIDHDFMAARPGHPIIKEFLDRIHTLHELANNPELVKFFIEPRLAHSWTNARLLTEIFSLFSEFSDSKVLILPNDEAIIAAHHQTSWYGGNGKSCRDIDKTTMNWFKVTPNYKHLHEDLLSNGFNLGLYKRYFAQALRTSGELTHHFLTQSKGVKTFVPSSEQSLPVAVTLTSWPGKIKDAHIAIESLLRQKFHPNKIILWLADEEFPERIIPSTISHLIARGLEVRWCENIKSAKKLIPALRDSELREMLLVAADDDIVYQPDWLELLIHAHREYPSDIIAHRTRVMNLNEEFQPKAYKTWRLLKDPSSAKGKILFPTSGGGVLFPPNALHPEVLNTSNFMKLCHTGDDIFWFAMSVLQGTKIRVPSEVHVNIIDINDDEAKAVSLWDSTNQFGRNDEMIRDVFGAYNIYSLLKSNAANHF